MSYNNLILSDSPVAYFPLDEASGGNSVTDVVGARVLTGVADFLNFQLGAEGRHPSTKALRLTAAARLEGVGTPIPGGSFSFECWIRPDAALDGVSDSTYFRTFGGAIITTRYRGVGKAISAFNDGGASFSDYQIITPNNSAPINIWQHVVYTVDAPTLTAKVFINGVQRGTRTIPSAGGLTSTNWRIGTWDATGLQQYLGWMQDMAIYDYVLTDTQITAHYDAGLIAPTTLPQPVISSVTPLSTSALRVAFSTHAEYADYEIERGGTTVATGVTASPWDDSGLTANTEYSYRVRGRTA
jgi:hypothetical protein